MNLLGERRRGPSPAPGVHVLLVAGSDARRRIRAARWVGRELARGAKVYYKGWPDDGPAGSWIAGPAGAPGGGAAVASGQLEILDFPTVVRRCGGSTEGLFALQDDECRRAVAAGWPSVAMSQESPCRPMADDAEAAELAAQEHGYDELARRWPLTTLCQLDLDAENVRAVRATIGVHHREVVDESWSATSYGGFWRLHGELDVTVAARFGAALDGALRDAPGPGADPELHVDLAAVEFMDLTCVRILASAVPRRRVVVHRASALLDRLVRAVPRSAVVDDTGVTR